MECDGRDLGAEHGMVQIWQLKISLMIEEDIVCHSGAGQTFPRTGFDVTQPRQLLVTGPKHHSQSSSAAIGVRYWINDIIGLCSRHWLSTLERR